MRQYCICIATALILTSDFRIYTMLASSSVHAYHAWRAIEFYIKDSCFYNGCLFLPENLILEV